MSDIVEKVLKWIAKDEDVGVSSKAMALAACEIENNGTFGNCAPSDPSDFNRCLKLTDQIPEIKDHFDKISKLSDKWKAITERWVDVERSFIDEVGYDWCNGRTAPITYKLMKDIYSK